MSKCEILPTPTKLNKQTVKMGRAKAGRQSVGGGARLNEKPRALEHYCLLQRGERIEEKEEREGGENERKQVW